MLSEIYLIKDATEKGHDRIPKYEYHSTIGGRKFFIFEYLEHSLEHFISSYNSNFEVALIEASKQMLQAIQQVHSLNHLHNDVKPDNFMCKNSKIYIIDFGVITGFGDERNTAESYSPFQGSLYYAPIRAHK